MNNPYIFRGPVQAADMFIGRGNELDEIVAFLRGNQSVSIVGPRKIGKTSLLFHLRRVDQWPKLGLDDSHLMVYLDCEVLGEGNHDEIFCQFAMEIQAALDDRQLPPEPALDAAIELPGRLPFERALRKLNQRGLRVVLILDEFERISANKHLNLNFFNALRSAAGRYQLAFITASARPLIQLTYSNKSQEILSSPFFNIFAPLFLGLLPEAEACELMHRPAQAAGIEFSPEVSRHIYHLVGGFPLGLQVGCFHAFEIMKTTGMPPLAEIESRTSQEMSPHFEYYWHNLTPAEQDTLQHVPDVASLASTDTTLRGILRDLVQKCLVVYQNGSYHYPSRLWAAFVNSQAAAAAFVPRRSQGGAAPAMFGPYQVVEPLGKGGMAEVFKGFHPRLERTVAIKVLPAKLASETDFTKRFEREARAVAALRHPNIVQVFDFGDVEGAYYMVMEFISGKDLAALLRTEKVLSLEKSLAIMHDIAGALGYAHSQGLIHRDVKPSNVLLEPQPNEASAYRAVLTDFGIAKIFSGDTSATQTGMMMGTLDYMAPEQIRSAGDVDQRADVYALGVMLYQMLTGQLPFRGDNPGAVMLAHIQQPIPDARRLTPDLPTEIADAIRGALAKEPSQRIASPLALMQALQPGNY